MFSAQFCYDVASSPYFVHPPRDHLPPPFRSGIFSFLSTGLCAQFRLERWGGGAHYDFFALAFNLAPPLGGPPEVMFQRLFAFDSFL